jgi:hypothetical protein
VARVVAHRRARGGVVAVAGGVEADDFRRAERVRQWPDDQRHAPSAAVDGVARGVGGRPCAEE